MRVITVDDEIMSLMRLERILKDLPNVSFAGGYQNPEDAILNQNSVRPEVAFLDVEMPQMSGLALAERLTERDPNLEIIFVTAHEQYALKAYQQNAIGYLLKPVQPEDVQTQIERVLRYRRERTALQPEVLRCCVFGSFHVRIGPDFSRVVAFRTEKTAELLALLINQRGKPISRDTICMHLWPDMNSERAARNFHTTAYNIRHTFAALGFQNVLQRSHESYWINFERMQSDLEVFCTAVEMDLHDQNWITAVETAVDLYSGVYLSDMDYIWLMEHQTYYEYQFEKLCRQLADRYEQMGKRNLAIDVALRWMRQCPFSEDASTRLERLYQASGEIEKAALVRVAFERHTLQDIEQEIDKTKKV